MVTWAARRKSRNVKDAGRYAGRRAANSPVLRFLARAGLAARGVMYVVIGWIADQRGCPAVPCWGAPASREPSDCDFGTAGGL